MQIYYLEIVTPDIDTVCKLYEDLHAVTFSKPQDALGGARLASLSDGGKIGVRAPMHADEAPVVRPYLLVDDIAKAVSNAEKAGALIAHPPMELPGFGTFAIYIIDDLQHGLWQAP